MAGRDKKGFHRVGDDVDRLLFKRICVQMKLKGRDPTRDSESSLHPKFEGGSRARARMKQRRKNDAAMNLYEL